MHVVYFDLGITDNVYQRREKELIYSAIDFLNNRTNEILNGTIVYQLEEKVKILHA